MLNIFTQPTRFMTPQRRFNLVLRYWFSSLDFSRLFAWCGALDAQLHPSKATTNSQPRLLFKWINYENHSQISHTLKWFSFCAFHVKSNKMKTNKQRNILFYFIFLYKNFFWINFKFFWLWAENTPKPAEPRNIGINMHEIIIAKMLYAHVNKGLLATLKRSFLSTQQSFDTNKIAFMINLHIYWL